MESVVVDDFTKEISEKYNQKEKVIEIMYSEYLKSGYDRNNFEKEIENYYNTKNSN